MSLLSFQNNIITGGHDMYDSTRDRTEARYVAFDAQQKAIQAKVAAARKAREEAAKKYKKPAAPAPAPVKPVPQVVGVSASLGASYFAAAAVVQKQPVKLTASEVFEEDSAW
jgi:hypothetical protein